MWLARCEDIELLLMREGECLSLEMGLSRLAGRQVHYQNHNHIRHMRIIHHNASVCLSLLFDFWVEFMADSRVFTPTLQFWMCLNNRSRSKALAVKQKDLLSIIHEYSARLNGKSSPSAGSVTIRSDYKSVWSTFHHSGPSPQPQQVG